MRSVSGRPHVVHKTNLIFKQEVIKLSRALKDEQFQRAFATELRELLYGASEPETRFNSFTAVLANGEVANLDDCYVLSVPSF